MKMLKALNSSKNVSLLQGTTNAKYNEIIWKTVDLKELY